MHADERSIIHENRGKHTTKWVMVASTGHRGEATIPAAVHDSHQGLPQATVAGQAGTTTPCQVASSPEGACAPPAWRGSRAMLALHYGAGDGRIETGENSHGGDPFEHLPHLITSHESLSRLRCKCLQRLVNTALRCECREPLCPTASEAWEA
jgi:hypothetical protein